jgi:hypothetical protein
LVVSNEFIDACALLQLEQVLLDGRRRAEDVSCCPINTAGAELAMPGML